MSSPGRVDAAACMDRLWRRALFVSAAGCLVLSAALTRSTQAEEPTVGDLEKRGAAFYERRQFSEALAAYETALERAAASERPHIRRVLARIRSALAMQMLDVGEVRQAQRILQRAKQDALDPLVHVGLGMVAFLRAEDQSAREELTRAIELDPGQAVAYKILAVIAYRAGEVERALQLLREAHQRDPRDVEAKKLLERWENERAHSPDQKRTLLDGFVLFSDTRIDSEQLTRYRRMVRRAGAHVRQALAHRSRANVVVVLLPDADFHAAIGAKHWVGGRYDGQVKLPVPVGTPSPQELDHIERALRHELTHAHVREIAPLCPGWLNEGLAQLLGEAPASEEIARRLKTVQRLHFEQLPVRLAAIEDEELVRSIYLHGLGFVVYLQQRYHLFRLRLLLDELKSQESLSKAFENTYGKSLGALQDEWWALIEEQRASGQAAPGPAVDDAGMSAGDDEGVAPAASGG